MLQQNKLTETLMSAVNLRESRRFESVRPEIFDGSSDSPESWISFHEQAAQYNEWKFDRERLVNMRPFRAGLASKWHESRLLDYKCEPWSKRKSKL